VAENGLRPSAQMLPADRQRAQALAGGGEGYPTRCEQILRIAHGRLAHYIAPSFGVKKSTNKLTSFSCLRPKTFLGIPFGCPQQ
jgi:hypothetical protein